MKKKPSILFIIDYYHPHIGGLEIVFENIVSRLAKKGYKIGILTIKHMPTLPAYEQQGNIEIRRVGNKRSNFLRYAYQHGKKIIEQYDIIHTTTYASAIPASILGRQFNKPSVLTVHEIFGRKLRQRYKPYRRRLYQRFEQIIFRFPYTHIICVSQYTKRMVKKLYKVRHKNLSIIHNGIDRKIRNKSQKSKKIIQQLIKTHYLQPHYVILYYGHSGVSKGLDALIKSIPHIIKKIPNAKFVLNIIPGKRDYKTHRLIKKLGVEQYITLLHGVQQQVLINLIFAADVVIVPSISEGFGLAAAEVSALEHPLIISGRGALPEVSSGKVITLGSLKPKSFLNAIKKAQAQQRKAIPPKHFDRDETIDSYINIYKQTTT